MFLSVAKDAYLKKCSKTTHYVQNYLLKSFYRVILLKFFQESLQAALHFVCISTSHAHFPINEIRIPWMPMRPSTLFFACKMPEKWTRKADPEVCERLLCLVFDWEGNSPSRQSLPVRECNMGFV